MSVHESPRSLKRDHDSFAELTDLEQPFSVPADYLDQTKAAQPFESPYNNVPVTTNTIATKQSSRSGSPARSTTESLSDVGPVTPSYVSDSPVLAAATNTSLNTISPSALSAGGGGGNAAPAAKKAKVVNLSSEQKKAEKEAKDKARAEEKARKEADRQMLAEEKSRKEAEKEVEKKRKEAEKEAERAVREEKKKLQDEKKRKKEEEKQKEEEAKRKKEQSQKRLSSFFTIPAASKARRGSVESKERVSMSPGPHTSNPSLGASSANHATATAPRKSEQSCYLKTFPEFWVHHDVKVAKSNRFERDEDGIQSVQSALDSYMSGSRSPGKKRSFDAVQLFHLSSQDILRGKRCVPVREIMTEFSGNSARPIDLTTESQNTQIKKRGELLRKVPLKFISFVEDVRPAYRGTYSSRPIHGFAKLGRNPLRKDNPNTNYDYDSEAEWVEDEDAEDCNSDGDDEEEEEGEDMDGFLDDENEDPTNSRRAVLNGSDLVPTSTGLCWEDKHKKSTNVKMMPYRMEIIIDPTLKSIDPFSTSYWELNPTAAVMDPPRLPLTTMRNPNTSNIPSIKPLKQFFTPASALPPQVPPPTVSSNSKTPTAFPTPQTAAGKKGPSKNSKQLSPDELAKFKEAVEGNVLSKVGLVEVLNKQFPGPSKSTIKDTLDLVAKRVGGKNGRWVLNP